MSSPILHKTITVDGLDIFYREAGNPDNPALLLLHGFPSSSVMFKDLMMALADEFYLIAPDYPGFGFSAFPDKDRFEYTFRNISAYINRFTELTGLHRFRVYLHDYGCAVGLPLCIAHPGKIEGLIVQNGNTYMEGIGPQWDETLDYWTHPTEEKKRKVYAFLSPEGTKAQYTDGLPAELLARIGPETWTLDWERMSRPGNIDMQFELNCDYRNHMELFSVFQEYFRRHRPPTLVLWGRYDVFFSLEEAHCYKRDLPHAQVHILDGGHMLLETHLDEVHTLIRNFMRTK